MTSHGNGRPLPKFGDWDVNNPASADGFTVIFARARDEKKATGTAANAGPLRKQQVVAEPQQKEVDDNSNKNNKWLCCM